MPLLTEKLTDEELLALCELADEIDGHAKLGKPLTDAEQRFLDTLTRLQLWSEKGRDF